MTDLTDPTLWRSSDGTVWRWLPGEDVCWLPADDEFERAYGTEWTDANGAS
jgi:hypothetical protein